MSSPPFLPLLLLFAVASAGPLELPEGTSLPATTPAAPAAPIEEQAVPAATVSPPSEGQYCTVDGAVFHNGERLPVLSTSDPCRACYCQGGESVCTRVHCYRRPDCAPRHVPGSCCPKYDNCPPAPDDRQAEPRVKEVATQTDPVEPTDSTTTPVTEMTVTNTPGTPATQDDATTTTVTEWTTNTGTTGTTAGSIAPPTTVTHLTESTTTTESTTDEAPEESSTSAYPPGIDLHALHEHLPFLSPGDANGPNT